MRKSLITTVLLAGASVLSFSQNIDVCKAYLHNDTLTLETGKVFEKFKWNKGNLVRIGFGLQSSKKSIVAPDNAALFAIKELSSDGELVVTKQPANPQKDAYLKAEVICKDGSLEIKREFQLYTNCPAIRCDIYFRGNTSESSVFSANTNEIASDRYTLKGVHWYGKAIEFFDVTDRNNTLVREYFLLSYKLPKFDYPGIKHENQLRGNILFLENRESEERMFLLKEAPCSSVQLSYPGYDFTLTRGEVKIVGLGLTSEAIKDSEWVRGYGTVAGISETNDELGVLTALREYQKTIRTFNPGRDEMIMINTWGDMSKDSRVNEEFALKELEAGAKIGATHLQLDDGWQTGKSANTAFGKGTTENIWKDNTYWQPHPERFPNGLDRVIKLGKELGIEISLWFHQSQDNSLANWEKDADLLIGLYKKHGIKIFKNDGVNLPDKQSDINFRKFLDKIRKETNYDVVFNQDATFGKHGSYNYFNEYGNLFVENRFTDWHDYFPYTTLRNIWMLSKYIPAQNLQLEFLNNTRNAVMYAGDPFAPDNYSFDYCFAITMVGQPLAWFEASNLPKELLEKGGEVINKYKSIMNDLHKGNIFPIGDEPSGRSWTGFQSIQHGKGYFIVFRELNDKSKVSMKTWLKKGENVALEPIIGKGKAFKTVAGDDGIVTFELPEKNSYALYSYRISK